MERHLPSHQLCTLAVKSLCTLAVNELCTFSRKLTILALDRLNQQFHDLVHESSYQIRAGDDPTSHDAQRMDHNRTRCATRTVPWCPADSGSELCRSVTTTSFLAFPSKSMHPAGG
jgi:hypothetical protein